MKKMSSSQGCGDFELNDKNLLDGKMEHCKDLTSAQKWWVSFFVAVLFFVIASPVAYDFTSSISLSIGGPRLSGPGASLLGLFIHALIFMLVVRLILW